MTVPPRGVAARCLLDRFATATGLPPGIWDSGQDLAVRNVALGAAEVEAVRRLNDVLVPRLNQDQHRFVVEARAPAPAGRRPTASAEAPC